MKRSKQEGFTLLEVVIAVAIMALAFGAILAVEGSAIHSTTRAKQMNVVGMLAKNQMIEAEFKIRNKTFEEVRKEEEGVFPAPYQTYRWKVQVKEIKFPRISAPKPKTGDNNAEMSDMVAKLTSNFFSKAIREVTVSVIWKQGSKDQSYSVSTYWVNLNHEFSIME